MKKQSFLISHGTYPYDVLVSLGQDHAQVSKHLAKLLHRPLTDEEASRIEMPGRGRTVMLPGNQTVVRVRLNKDKSKFHAVLAHEIFHAVEMLFDHIGLKHNYDAGEAFAYQIQHLTEQIYKRL